MTQTRTCTPLKDPPEAFLSTTVHEVSEFGNEAIGIICGPPRPSDSWPPAMTRFPAGQAANAVTVPMLSTVTGDDGLTKDSSSTPVRLPPPSPAAPAGPAGPAGPIGPIGPC